MAELFRNAVLAGIGLITEGSEMANKMVKELVKRGEVSQKEGEKLLRDLLKKGEEARKQFAEGLHKGAEEVLGRADIATKEDIEKLTKRVASLERKLRGAAKAK
jgi:polyhydroxyalkanoate synthesis regulator phasin